MNRGSIFAKSTRTIKDREMGKIAENKNIQENFTARRHLLHVMKVRSLLHGE
jgi:hypothetical protein